MSDLFIDGLVPEPLPVKLIGLRATDIKIRLN